MKFSPVRAIVLALFSLSLPACNMHKEEHHHDPHKITATNPESKSVTITQQFVCQIHSKRHVDVRALERGYLEEITVKEGQEVKAGDPLFKVIPILYQARLEAETAKFNLAKLELEFTETLSAKKVVSPNEVLLNRAKMKEAEAKVKLAEAELNFATVKAAFDGIIDRQQLQHGSLIEEGEILTTLSDNSVMWVYFNVPEKRYLEYMNGENKKDMQVELMLADGQKFPYVGTIGAIEADFNNKTGNIKFRADFENPNRLLRHGQTGTVLIRKVVSNAIVIPQRAVFEVLQKRYVYVVDKEDVVHQREIVVQNEMDDLYVVKGEEVREGTKTGLGVEDRIVLEGTRQVHDGDKVEYEDRGPEQVAANLKFHAE